MIESTSRAGLGPLIGQYFGLEHTLGIWKFGIDPLEKEGSPTIDFEKRSFNCASWPHLCIKVIFK